MLAQAAQSTTEKQRREGEKVMEMAIFYAGTAIGFFVLAYFEQRSKKKKAAKAAEEERQYTLARKLETEEKARRSWESIVRASK